MDSPGVFGLPRPTPPAVAVGRQARRRPRHLGADARDEVSVTACRRLVARSAACHHHRSQMPPSATFFITRACCRCRLFGGPAVGDGDAVLSSYDMRSWGARSRLIQPVTRLVAVVRYSSLGAAVRYHSAPR